MSEIEALLRTQSGVVARMQLVEHGLVPHEIRRLLRRHDLTPVFTGVYVDHTGPLTWLQEAWAAVLALWPAALSHESAIRADDGPGRTTSGTLHVAVDRRRSPSAPPGIRLHQLADLDAKVRWNTSPPRVRIEEAVIDVAAEAGGEMSCIATLADAVQARRTTAARLRAAVDGRSRLARRQLIAGVLADVELGTCSVLEHGYLTRVERPHGLPMGRRQLLIPGRAPSYADVEYPPHGVRVELDGRLFHDTAQARDLDLERDLDAVLVDTATARLGWGQVFDRPCSTAVKVGRLLRARGWGGSPTTCPECDGRWQYAGATG